MPDLQNWIKLYRSPNHEVRVRAARRLLQRGDETPLAVLLDILDRLHHEGLGAETERAIAKRRDPELFAAMIERAESPSEFVRETACRWLGRLRDRRATPYLSKSIDDPRQLVRLAALYALADLKDPTALPRLAQTVSRWREQDENERRAVQTALKSIKSAKTEI